uniref:Uncharacterized protein n=1 Tax=Acrobeloides nanus TaxID=290746 RepID=A0A914BWA7_9BILA
MIVETTTAGVDATTTITNPATTTTTTNPTIIPTTNIETDTSSVEQQTTTQIRENTTPGVYTTGMIVETTTAGVDATTTITNPATTTTTTNPTTTTTTTNPTTTTTTNPTTTKPTTTTTPGITTVPITTTTISTSTTTVTTTSTSASTSSTTTTIKNGETTTALTTSPSLSCSEYESRTYISNTSNFHDIYGYLRSRYVFHPTYLDLHILDYKAYEPGNYSFSYDTSNGTQYCNGQSTSPRKECLMNMSEGTEYQFSLTTPFAESGFILVNIVHKSGIVISPNATMEDSCVVNTAKVTYAITKFCCILWPGGNWPTAVSMPEPKKLIVWKKPVK